MSKGITVILWILLIICLSLCVGFTVSLFLPRGTGFEPQAVVNLL